MLAFLIAKITLDHKFDQYTRRDTHERSKQEWACIVLNWIMEVKLCCYLQKKKQQSKWNRLLWWHNMKMFWANTVKRMNILFATFCKLQFAFYDKSTNLLNNTLPPPPLSSVLLLLFCCRFHRRNTFPLFLRSLHDTHIHVIFVESLDVTLPLIAERNGYVIVCVLKSFLNGCYGIHVFFFSA